MCRASNSRSATAMARMTLAECFWMQRLIMKSGSGDFAIISGLHARLAA